MIQTSFQSSDSRFLMVFNVAAQLSEKDLRALLEMFGPLRQVYSK